MLNTAGRVVPVVEAWLAPVVLWDQAVVSADGAAMACPQCAGSNLHLGMVHFAAPTEDHYTPTVGLAIHAATAVAVVNDQQARALHAGRNRGPMLAIGYWCEQGCCGRLELREHKGHLYASLHNEAPQLPPDGPEIPPAEGADLAGEGDEPPF